MQIGSFEHNLTTDLLNHLVFLQKVFMKEVNEVIQKVSGTIPKDSHTDLHFINCKTLIDVIAQHGES